jgi:prolyl-tRNA editing enzyme YbaK/EbsC (Cys-tRNA(Pro) deacylase)
MSNPLEEKLKSFMQAKGIRGEHRVFSQSCHSVAEAAAAVRGTSADFVKNVCLVDEKARFIIAIVKGEDRVSTARVAQTLGAQKVRTASPAEVLERTGYPAGGTPSFGYEAIFLIDPKVMEREKVYTGGGSENSLVLIDPRALHQANHGQIVRIRKG